MNWEVRTMRSKTSFFNKRLYLNDLKSQIPTIVLFLLGYFSFLFIPGMMEVSRSLEPDMAGDTASKLVRSSVLVDLTDWMTNPVLIGVVAIMIAVVLFHYQYSRSSSYMLHSMPIRRMAHFVSHALAGLTVLMILEVVIFSSMFVITGAETQLIELIILRALEGLVEVLFFYALALFTVVVCGNMILSIVTFGVLNALWLFINMLAAFMRTLIVEHPIASSGSWGFRYMIFESLDGLFPAYFFMKCHDQLEVVTNTGEVCYRGGFLNVLWMLIPTVILAVLAALLYKNKRLEKTGETVTFGWCKIVFRVLFTFCGGGLVMGSAFVLMRNQFALTYGENGGLIAFAIGLLIIGSIVGFFISEMLLQKSVNIFHSKKTRYLHGAIPLALMLLYVALLSMHVIGPAIKPNPDHVVRIEISSSDFVGNYYFDAPKDEEAIRNIAQAHRELVEDPKLLETEKHSMRGGDIKGYVQFRFVDDDGDWLYLDYAYDNDGDKKRLFDTFMSYGKTPIN